METDKFLYDVIRRRESDDEMKNVEGEEASAKEAEITQKGLEHRSEASIRTTKESAEEKKERYQACKRRRNDSMEDDEWNGMVRTQLDEKRSQ